MITLDIDSTTIKLMETRDRKVIKWASLSLEPTMAEEEEAVPSQQELGSAVKSLMASSGIQGSEVIASVSGLYSTSHILATSELVRGLPTPQAIEATAQDIMPLPPEELYLSWKNIPASDESEPEILAIGVPREVIDAEVQALKKVGVNPRVLELKAMALARAVNKEQALILNIERADIDIVMIVNGLPEIMRTVAWQPDNLDLEDRVEHLVTTLELTVGYYNSNNPNTPLDPATPLFITGEMSGDPPLMEKLLARMRYPIELLAPPLECPEHLPVSQYAVNIGLTLKEMAPTKIPEPGSYLLPDINLLPEIYQPWKPSARQIYFSLLLIVVIALLFPLYQVTTEAMGETAKLQRKYDAIESQIQQKQLKIKNRVPLEKAIDDYGTVLNMHGRFIEVMKVINDTAEGLGVKLSSTITHQGNRISFSAEAEDYLTFRKFITALEESGRFATPIKVPAEGYPYATGSPFTLVPKTGK